MRRRRLRAKRLVEGYFQNLMEGCGNSACTNPNCASSSGFKKLHKSEALKKALALASKANKPKMCVVKQNSREGEKGSESAERRLETKSADAAVSSHGSARTKNEVSSGSKALVVFTAKEKKYDYDEEGLKLLRLEANRAQCETRYTSF